ncbi:hypothetical protein ACQY0O_001293 [Thecaphora frezii]
MPSTSSLRWTQGLALLLCLLCTMASPTPQPASSSNAHKGELHLIATNYNGNVLPYTVNPSSSSLAPAASEVAAMAFGHNPGWICYPPSFSASSKKAVDRVVYIIDGAGGNIYAASVESLSPLTLKPVGEPVSSDGQEPVSCSVGHGPSANTLFVANYGSGTATYFRLDAESGAIDAASRQIHQFTRNGTGPVADRQDHSYAHQTQVSPTGTWVYVCDLGGDVIHRFQVTANDKPDALAHVVYKGATQVEVGSGPRHITFYPPLASNAKGHAQKEKYYAYLASELSSTVSAFEHNDATGELKQLGKPLFPFPAGTPLSGPGILPTNRTTAEIEVSPDGLFTYVSDRGDAKEDHISIFKRDADSGELTFVKWVGSGGLLPRHFSLSTPSDGKGAYLISAHQNSQDLVLFQRNLETGDLHKLNKIADAGSVVYAGFLKA